MLTKSPSAMQWFRFTASSDRTAHRMVVHERDLEHAMGLMFGKRNSPHQATDGIFEIDLKRTGNPVVVDAPNRSKRHAFPWSPVYIICSREVRDVLEGVASDEFDYINVQIFAGGQIWLDVGEYFVLSTRRILECHDPKLTVWSKDPNVRIIDKFFFDPTRVPAGVHCFRPAGRVEWQIISNTIRDALIRHKFKGCDFLPVVELFP